jgi:hypothetical protein
MPSRPALRHSVTSQYRLPALLHRRYGTTPDARARIPERPGTSLNGSALTGLPETAPEAP